MALDLNKLTADPEQWLRAAAFGLPKSGKSHCVATLAMAVYETLGLDGHIAYLDTENASPDWHKRMARVTGKPPAVQPLTIADLAKDPLAALKFVRECEQDERISVLIVDSVTDLLEWPRKIWVRENSKGIPLNLYSKIDAPFHAFVEWAKHARIHLLATMRPTDDKDERDGQEIVVGKVGKGKDFAYVPRLEIHCTKRKGKAGTAHQWTVTDAKNTQPTKTYIDAKMDIWPPYLEPYK